MSAPVTDWGVRSLLVLLVLAAIVGLLLLMRLGWKRRGHRQSGIPAPEAIPADIGQPLGGGDRDGVEGLYLGTVTAGDWLDRIVVHGLGVRSRARVRLGGRGVAIERSGAPDVWIPLGDITSVRADRGIAGRAYERDGVVIVTWSLGGRLVDTGFRAERAEAQAEVLSVLGAAIGGSHTEGATS